jgi:hypothetical protein
VKLYADRWAADLSCGPFLEKIPASKSFCVYKIVICQSVFHQSKNCFGIPVGIKNVMPRKLQTFRHFEDMSSNVFSFLVSENIEFADVVIAVVIMIKINENLVLSEVFTKIIRVLLHPAKHIRPDSVSD